MPDEPAGPPPYEMRIDDKQWDEIESWGARTMDVLLAFIREHASRTPTARFGWRLKKLRTPHEGLYQFSVNRDLRFIYRVDEEERAVIAEYVGPHPDWEKSRRGRITS